MFRFHRWAKVKFACDYFSYETNIFLLTYMQKLPHKCSQQLYWQKKKNRNNNLSVKNWWIVKHIVAHPYYGILFSH